MNQDDPSSDPLGPEQKLHIYSVVKDALNDLPESTYRKVQKLVAERVAEVERRYSFAYTVVAAVFVFLLSLGLWKIPEWAADAALEKAKAELSKSIASKVTDDILNLGARATNTFSAILLLESNATLRVRALENELLFSGSGQLRYGPTNSSHSFFRTLDNGGILYFAPSNREPRPLWRAVDQSATVTELRLEGQITANLTAPRQMKISAATVWFGETGREREYIERGIHYFNQSRIAQQFANGAALAWSSTETASDPIAASFAHTNGAFRFAGSPIANGNALWTAGKGSPEGVVKAGVGSIYSRIDSNPESRFLYVKVFGAESTGWAAVETGAAVVR